MASELNKTEESSSLIYNDSEILAQSRDAVKAALKEIKSKPICDLKSHYQSYMKLISEGKKSIMDPTLTKHRTWRNIAEAIRRCNGKGDQIWKEVRVVFSELSAEIFPDEHETNMDEW